jgi:hypothetical protein
MHLPVVFGRCAESSKSPCVLPASWPGLSPQVGFTRLAAPNNAQLGRARVAVPSTFCRTKKQDVDARDKRGHDQRMIASLRGLTRQSIPLRKSFFAKKMDARVKSARASSNRTPVNIPLASFRQNPLWLRFANAQLVLSRVPWAVQRAVMPAGRRHALAGATPVFSCFSADSGSSIPSHDLKHPHLLVPAARFLRPGFCNLCSDHPDRGGAERRETFGCSGTRWACADASKTRVNALMTPHARHLARRLASHSASRRA